MTISCNVPGGCKISQRKKETAETKQVQQSGGQASWVRALRSVEANGSIPQSGHTHPLLPPPASLPTFPLDSAPPYRKWEPHAGDHCRGAPSRTTAPPQGRFWLLFTGPSQKSATLGQFGSRGPHSLGGQEVGGGTPWRICTPHIPSIPTSFSPSDQPPAQPFLQRIVWGVLLFFGFFFFLDRSTQFLNL